MLKSGVYKILSWIDGKFYIGSSVNILKRWQDHRHLLKRNIHRNSHLQFAWNKYGAANFSFSIIEYCEKSNLLEREQYWIDLTNCNNDKIGYNFSKFATSTQLGLKRSDETREKLRQSHLGKKRSKEHIESIRKARTGFVYSDKAKINMSIAQKNNLHLRNLNKWPHALGSRCKCFECREKRLEYGREWWRINHSNPLNILGKL